MNNATLKNAIKQLVTCTTDVLLEVFLQDKDKEKTTKENENGTTISNNQSDGGFTPTGTKVGN